MGWVRWVGDGGERGWGGTFLIAELRLGLGVELLAPKRRFMLEVECPFLLSAASSSRCVLD